MNVGCVPSKALLRCARAVAELRRHDLGIDSNSTAKVDFAKVMERALGKENKVFSPLEKGIGTVNGED